MTQNVNTLATVSMTQLRSLASTKPPEALDILDVAGLSILVVGDMMSALRAARCNDAELFGILASLQTRFKNITGEDGFTTYVPHVDADDVPSDFGEETPAPVLPTAVKPIGTGFNGVPTVAPVIVPQPENDIARLDQSILVELASRKRMSGKEIRSFVAGAGENGKEAIARLEGTGRIVPVGKQGRGFIYSLPEAKTVPVTPDASAMVTAVVMMSLPGDIALHNAHVDTFAKKVDPTPAKRKATPTVTPVAPPAPVFPGLKDGVCGRCGRKAGNGILCNGLVCYHAPVTPPAPVASEDIPADFGDTVDSPTAPTVAPTGPDTLNPAPATLADVDNDTFFAELRRRTASATLPAHDHDYIDRHVRGIARLMGVTL